MSKTKWCSFGSTLGLLGHLLADSPRVVLPLVAVSSQMPPAYELNRMPVAYLAVLLVPLSTGVAVLRYRLWDIDLIINRTLVYGSLTAILGGLFSASTTLSQRVFVALTGEKSDAAFALTTLVVVSLFTP